MQSIKLLAQKFFFINRLARRFPATLGLVLIAPVIALFIFYQDKWHLQLLKSLFSITLAIPLSIALTYFFENYRLKFSQVYTLSIVIIFVFFHYLFTVYDVTLNYTYQFIHLFILIHILSAFSPFLFKAKESTFWVYNYLLFKRLILAVFYGAVTFLSIILLLLLIDYLFDIKFNSFYELSIFVFCLYVVQTLVFLKGVPTIKELEESNSLAVYPQALKIFLQFILIPFILIYLTIMYVYLGKIIITWHIPKGLTSWLVLGLGIVGVLSYCILNNKVAKIKSKWVLFFELYFFYLIIPLIALLLVSLSIRIQDYGVTINRYILVALAIWLLVVAMVFIFKKNTSIKFIPISLSILLIFSFWGPWGAYQLSYLTQKKIVQNILKKYKILDHKNKLQRNQEKIAFADRKKMSTVLVYLNEHYGNKIFSDIFGETFSVAGEINSNGKRFHFFSSSYGTENVIENLKKLDIKYVESWVGGSNEDSESLNLYFDLNDSVMNIAGYDKLISFNLFEVNEVNIEDYLIKKDENSYSLLLLKNDVLLARIPLEEKIDSLYSQMTSSESSDDWDSEAESVEVKTKSLDIKLLFRNLNVSKRKNDSRHGSDLSVSGSILIKYKGEK